MLLVSALIKLYAVRVGSTKDNYKELNVPTPS
jgi:hypothetical protein